MKRSKRTISLLLALVLMLSACSFTFTAQASMESEAESYETGTWYKGYGYNRSYLINVNQKSYVSLDAVYEGTILEFNIYNSNGKNVLKHNDLGFKYNSATDSYKGHCGRFFNKGTYYLYLKYVDCSYRSKNEAFKFCVQVEKAISLPKGKIKSLKSKKSGQFTVECDKASDAIGYRITYSTDERFKKNVKTVRSAGRTVKVSKLKKGKRYYVKVCPYTVYDDGTYVYGQNSLPKVIKVKK